VAGEDVEVRVERLHVDLEVHGALAAVDQHRDVAGMGAGDHVGDRHDGAGDVGHVRDRDHLRAWRERRLEGVEIEAAVVAHVDELQHRALPLAQEVPRHDVGMMFENGDDDLVARADYRRGEGRGDEVDGLGRALGEDDLFRPARIEEARDGLAAVLVGLGRAVGECVEAPMHVRVGVPVGEIHRIEHHVRLLRRGTGVEVDQPLLEDFFFEDREIGTDAG